MGVHVQVAKAAIVMCLFSITLRAQETQTSEVTPGQENAPDPAQSSTSQPQPVPTPQLPPRPSPYSHAYEVRQDLHKYASYATAVHFVPAFRIARSPGAVPELNYW